MSLPHLPTLESIAERLQMIFPEGTENRNYVVSQMASRTIYVMMYAGAIEGKESWIRPSQVTDMCPEQAAKRSDSDRKTWIKLSLANKLDRPKTSWYAPKSRGPLREETIRNGFIALGAVVEREGLPVITPLPKYTMEQPFAALFDEKLAGEDLENAIQAWQETHLNPNALRRIRLVGAHVTASKAGAIKTELPNAGAVMLDAGVKGVMSKAIFEQFAPKFLKDPAVIWFSEAQDSVGKELSKQLKIKLNAKWSLPSIILVDLGEKEDGSDMLFVFIEIAESSDDAINSVRKKSLSAIAKRAGIKSKQLVYVTVFQDRSVPEFKNAIGELSWGTSAWFTSEPANILNLTPGSSSMLSKASHY